MYYGIFVFLQLLLIYLFHNLLCNYSDESIQYFITHALFTLLVQCMEFTLSYYDITFCTTWCNKVASTKTYVIWCFYFSQTQCSSHSNDNIDLESSKSYWVDYLSISTFLLFFMLLCTCLLSFELVFIKITGKKVRNLVHK